MAARYRVYARDVDYRRTGEIPDFGQLDLQIRYNDVGSWNLRTSADTRANELLVTGGGIIVTRDLFDGVGPVTIFSGPIMDITRTAATLEVAGASDEVLLAERLALPDPSGPPYLTEQDIRSGLASTIMLEYVQYNCGDLATSHRVVPELVLGTDLGLGAQVYGQARFIGLLALLQELALSGGLRFQILQSDDEAQTIVFSVSEPPDKRNEVVISHGRGTLGDWNRHVIRPSASYVYVAGQGQGVNRVIVEGGNVLARSTYGRYVEAFVDRRDASDALVLEQTRTNTLAEGDEGLVVTFAPVDTPNFRWGREYDLGTLLTIITDTGGEETGVIRGVDMRLTVPGEGGTSAEVMPIISSVGDTADDPASRQERAVNRRVSNLERNLDSLAAVLAVQWNVGDYRETTRTIAAAGWLLCNGQAVSRTTYSGLFGVIGTTYGAGNGTTTFNVPDRRDRVGIGAGSTYVLGTTGGAATVDVSHNHGAGTLTVPNHQHAAGTLAGPSHTHAAGTLAGPSHFHTGPSHNHGVGTLAGPSHSHTAGTLGGPSHIHTLGTLSGPSHTHGLGTLAGPSHTHGNGTMTASSTGSLTSTPSAETNNLRTISPEEADASTKDHTHTFNVSASVGGTMGSAGTGAITGAMSADGTGAIAGSMDFGGTGSVGGSTAAGGTGAVTGATANDGTGNTGSDGTGAVTGSTGSSGTGSVTGSTANDATTLVTGSSGTSGSTTLSVVQPYIAVNYEIYAGV